jgi:hypothetical protein
MKRLIAIATAVIVSLAGCNGSRLAANDHFVSITITNDKIDAPDPDPVPVHGNHAVIHWEIKTPGYAFPDDGIVVTDDAGNEFSDGHPAEHGTKFQLNDKNSFRKQYKYTVSVVKGSTRLTKDPTIAND